VSSSYSLYPPDSPRRWPLAAGALGDYDPAAVERLASLVADDLTEAHRDSTSALYLDREPLRWSHAGDRGMAWSEGIFAGRGVASWQDAARSLGACGLVLSGQERLVHSSVAGALPLYYMPRGAAVYFASRIEALTAIADAPLSADWEAWAGIFSVGFVIGDRTPFREIRRLRPFATLRERRGAPSVQQETWPWAEIEPTRSIEEGLADVLDAMRAAAAAMREQPVLSALSGGWDSRLILALIMETGRPEVRAFTVNNDTGFQREERLAAEVANAFEVPHEVVNGRPEDYWDDFCERYRRSEYQRPSNAWLVTLARRLASEPGTVSDGFGLGALMGAASKLITSDVLESDDGRGMARELWHTHAKDGIVRGLTPEARRAISALAREQFLAEVEWLNGHPSQPILTRFWTSTVRGFSLAPATALGLEVRAATPFVTDDVATALLSIRHRDKFDGSLYRTLLEAVNPRAAALPSTHDTEAAPRTLQTRRLAAMPEYERALRASPLRELIGGKIALGLDEGDLSELLSRQRSHWRIAAIVMFSLWHERYRDRISELDPGELLGSKHRSTGRAGTLSRALRKPVAGDSAPAASINRESK
jgi:hypothetical protein